jgi:hypothetical protein
MMTKEEVLALPNNTLAMLADAKTGMVIGYPCDGREGVLIQVRGEKEARHVKLESLTRYGNSLLEGEKRKPSPEFDFDGYVARLYMLHAMHVESKNGQA